MGVCLVILLSLCLSIDSVFSLVSGFGDVPGGERLWHCRLLEPLSEAQPVSLKSPEAFFYYTADGRYMMKTVSTKEHQLLKRMLKRSVVISQ